MSRPENKQIEALDGIIARSLDLVDLADKLIYETDEPFTVGIGLEIKAKALSQQYGGVYIRDWLKAIIKKSRPTGEEKQ